MFITLLRVSAIQMFLELMQTFFLVFYETRGGTDSVWGSLIFTGPASLTIRPLVEKTMPPRTGSPGLPLLCGYRFCHLWSRYSTGMGSWHGDSALPALCQMEEGQTKCFHA